MSAVALAKAELPYTLTRAPLRRRASTSAEATVDLAEAPDGAKAGRSRGSLAAARSLTPVSRVRVCEICSSCRYFFDSARDAIQDKHLTPVSMIQLTLAARHGLILSSRFGWSEAARNGRRSAAEADRTRSGQFTGEGA